MLEINVVRKKGKTDVFKTIEKSLNVLEKTEVSSGFFKESKYPLNHKSKGRPVAMIAVWNNDGTPTIPPRPFMDKAALNMPDNKEFMKALEDTAVKALKGKGSNPEKLVLGSVMTEIIKNEILSTSKPSNKQSTIAAKGFDDPLIETGLMYDSVKHKLRKLK